MKSIHPDHEITMVTCSCSRVLSSIAYARHILTCDGIAPLQCPNCKQEFNSKSSKSRHNKEECEFVDMATYISNKNTHVAASNSTVNVNSNNVTNVVNNIINVNTQDGLRDVLDFFATNTHKVILQIEGNPSELQMAHKYGVTHAALTSMTHFTGSPENKNVLRMDSKTLNARIVDNGRSNIINTHKVLDQMQRNNIEIANDPRVKVYLTDDVNEQLLKPTPDDAAFKRERREMRQAVENKGDYLGKVRYSLPPRMPPARHSDDELLDMALGAIDGLGSDDLTMTELNTGVQEALQGAFLAACNQLTYVNKLWWESVPAGTGWVEFKGDIMSRLENILHDLKQKCVDRLLCVRELVPPGEEFARLRMMCDSICRYNIKPSAREVHNALQNTEALTGANT
jgi:hypothetical protein